MTSKNLSPDYWAERYRTQSTGWDIGQANAGLLAEVKQRADKKDRILIPGAGSSYEAVVLWEAGYRNAYVLDWTDAAFQRFRTKDMRARVAAAGIELNGRLIVNDFFKHTGSYDLIVEQTFFCAIDPKLRPSYVEQAHKLLRPEGKLIGVFFNREFENSGPPFGGSVDEYARLFERKFVVESLTPWSGSIPARLGSEALGVFSVR